AVRPGSPAPRDRTDRGIPPAPSKPAPGGLFRHGLSQRNAARREAPSDSAPPGRKGSPAVRLSRSFLRLPDGGARAGGRREKGPRPRDPRAFGQWGQPRGGDGRE